MIIALFGIVNTRGLSVYERMRELALLRAVGMEQRQLRSMIRWESVLIAVLGATFGLGIGILFGSLLVSALYDVGITTRSIPFTRLASAVVVAAIAGVIAAIGPARRAARVDVLRALEMT